MTASESTSGNGVRVEAITREEDFARFFEIVGETFGRQTKDGIWIAMNPGWDTPKGRETGVGRLKNRWAATTKNGNGEPNTIFLKATVPVPGQDAETIAGVAIWVQASMAEGQGEAPSTDLSKVMDLEAMYPGDPAMQRYLCQLKQSLHRRRIELVHEIKSSPSPSLMVLDLCVVDPSFQRRGIASKLVEWGLEEAKRRGGLEAVTEASSMGRHVYRRLGFQQEGPEIEYTVDEEFKGRDHPSNIFMRTGRAIR